MVEYQVLTEANGFGGWLENEDDLHMLEQAQAEMLRQEAQSFLEAFQGCHGMEETLSLAQRYVEIVE